MLEKLKKDIIDIAIRAENLGMCKHKSGNFSAFYKEKGFVLITPSGVSRSSLKPEDICVIDLDGNVIEWNGKNKPSSEVMMHILIYKSRPDVKAVVHTHARYSTVFAILNKEIPPIVGEFAFVGNKNNIQVAPYGKAGTYAVAENVAAKLKDSDSCLIQSHGAVAIGENLESALLKAEYVEEIAELYYLALTANCGKEPDILPKEDLIKAPYPEYIKF